MNLVEFGFLSFTMVVIFIPTGKSIQKFSIFYEVTKTGISSVSHTFNNIPTSLYPQLFNHMLNGEQKGIFINDFKDKKGETYGLKGNG